MTIRLYDEDHYLTEFDAIVSNIDGNRVELNQTAFYAESGGQCGDTGTLNDEKVVNTKYLDDHRCVHLMENKSRIKINDSIHGKINWDRRYRIMKLHTASHKGIFSMETIWIYEENR